MEVLENNSDSGGQRRNTREASWGGNGLRSPGGDNSKTMGDPGGGTSDAGGEVERETS